MIGGTIGIGAALEGAYVVGAAGFAELIGIRYGTPGVYFGGEVSFGAQAGGEFDVVVDVGFMQPADFGGWYFAVCFAYGGGIGGLVQVTWDLPALVAAGHRLTPQGFAIGGGVGVEVELSVAAGGGVVHLSQK